MPHEAGSDALLRLAAQLARDLRTPLTAVVTSLEMLAETEPDADQGRRRILNGAHRSARRMTGVVERLLRLNAVARTLDLAPVDLGTVAAHVVRDTALVVQTAGGRVEAGELPTVVADADQMYAVLVALVSNAVRFARPGVPPRVAISSTRTPDGWRVAVSDNGTGIPESERASLFDLTTRLGSVTRGEGIGLATVARIVEAHSGRAGAEESPTGGTTVWFELPARS
jgi:signal transduction histidine kinase